LKRRTNLSEKNSSRGANTSDPLHKKVETTTITNIFHTSGCTGTTTRTTNGTSTNSVIEAWKKESEKRLCCSSFPSITFCSNSSSKSSSNQRGTIFGIPCIGLSHKNKKLHPHAKANQKSECSSSSDNSMSSPKHMKQMPNHMPSTQQKVVSQKARKALAGNADSVSPNDPSKKRERNFNSTAMQIHPRIYEVLSKSSFPSNLD
jgi:hypothetical protein